MDPREVLYLYTSTTFTIVTAAAAYVYDKKTGKLIRVVWEMGEIVTPVTHKAYKKAASAVQLAANVLEATGPMSGAEELQVQAMKLAASAVEELAATLRTETVPVRES